MFLVSDKTLFFILSSSISEITFLFRNVETGISKPEATHKPSPAQSEPSSSSAKPKPLLREPVLSVKPLHLFSQV